MTTPRRGSCRASCRIASHPESKPALWQTQHSDGWQSTRWPTWQALPASDRSAHVQGSIQQGYAWAQRTQRDIFVDICGPVNLESFQLSYARRTDVDTYMCMADTSASLLCVEVTLVSSAEYICEAKPARMSGGYRCAAHHLGRCLAAPGAAAQSDTLQTALRPLSLCCRRCHTLQCKHLRRQSRLTSALVVTMHGCAILDVWDLLMAHNRSIRQLTCCGDIRVAICKLGCWGLIDNLRNQWLSDLHDRCRWQCCTCSRHRTDLHIVIHGEAAAACMPTCSWFLCKSMACWICCWSSASCSAVNTRFESCAWPYAPGSPSAAGRSACGCGCGSAAPSPVDVESSTAGLAAALAGCSSDAGSAAGWSVAAAAAPSACRG
jgi:hypothetical protein